MKRLEETLGVTSQEVERGLELHGKSIVCDSLSGDPAPFSQAMVQKTNEMLDAGKSLQDISRELEKMRLSEIVGDPKIRQEYVEAWRKSGVTCVVRGDGTGLRDLPAALKGISQYEYKFSRLKDILVKATSSKDIAEAKSGGKNAVILNLQNTLALGGGVDAERELDNLELLYGLGIRVMQLTYNLRNFVGDGCTERYQSGLSHFGTMVIEKMNKLGMLIDTSHCGVKTTLDAAEISKDPIAATHTSCRSVYDHPRGKTDEELKAIAEKNGYIGIYTMNTFLARQGTIKDFLDHIDYAVKLVGVDHIGIGTDNAYAPKPPERLIEKADKERNWWMGFRSEHRIDYKEMGETMREELAWTNWPHFTIGLISRGYSDQEVQKIIGGSFLATFERVAG